MNLLSIASGSSGNCICVGNNNTYVLIDTGISKKRIEEGLTYNNISPNDISAILITHEHIDHINGLGTFNRKYNVPIYSTASTIDQIRCNKNLGACDKQWFNIIKPDETFKIGDLTIKPFSVSHDAAEPVAYRFYSNDKSVAVATDLGYYDDYIINNLQNLNAILIEANHDIRMLQTGVYPYYLKQRILGNKGHLSNETAGRLLDSIINDDMKYIYLGHLSKENNYPDLAYESVRLEINMSTNKYKADDFDIQIAKRNEPMKLVEV